MIIANSRYGRRDIKNELDREFAAFHTYVDGKFAAIDSKLADLQASQKLTQGLVLSSAIKIMKAINGDQTELREFVKDAEKPCIEPGEDCQEVVNCDNPEMRELVKNVGEVLNSLDFEGWPKVDNCDKTEVREVKDAEKPLSCIELGEDCQEVVNCDKTEMRESKDAEKLGAA